MEVECLCYACRQVADLGLNIGITCVVVAHAFLLLCSCPGHRVQDQIKAEVGDIFHMNMFVNAYRPHRVQSLLVRLDLDHPGTIIHHESRTGNSLNAALEILTVEAIEPYRELRWGEKLQGNKLLVGVIDSHAVVIT